jgi:hypothetical protein
MCREQTSTILPPLASPYSRRQKLRPQYQTDSKERSIANNGHPVGDGNFFLLEPHAPTKWGIIRRMKTVRSAWLSAKEFESPGAARNEAQAADSYLHHN